MAMKDVVMVHDNRGCCFMGLETCVRMQGIAVAFATAFNFFRVFYKFAYTADCDYYFNDVKKTSVGAYIDLADFIVSGVAGEVLFVAALFLVRGVRLKRPRLMRPYLVVAPVVALLMAMYLVLTGIAVVQAVAAIRPSDFDWDTAVISVGEVSAIVALFLLLLLVFTTYFMVNTYTLYRSYTMDSSQIEHFYYIGGP